MRAEINRVAWRCRRGMLELDLLLQPFVESRYSSLTPVEREALDALLDHSDQELLEFLLGRAVPREEPLKHVIELIRHPFDV